MCHKCAALDKRKVQKCSGCKSTYYCSKECQRADWSTHKSQCFELREFHKSFLHKQVQVISGSSDVMNILGLIAHQIQLEHGLSTTVNIKVANNILQLELTPGNEAADSDNIVMKFYDIPYPMYEKIIVASHQINDVTQRINDASDILTRIDRPYVVHASENTVRVKTAGEMTEELLDILVKL